MNIQQAIDYLKRFQAWRTGEDERTMDEAGITPREVTKALNLVINTLEVAMEVK